MLRTAVFSAGPTICIASFIFICLKPQAIAMAWDNICLPCECWNPEAVDDVVRDKVNLHYHVGGYGQGISGNNMLVGVIEFPPPLMTNRPHLKLGSCWLLQVKHGVNGAC